ncbi:p-hydroxyphenylacetate 3-hydroxylase, reductase component [Corynebacterium occultum]|uniref:p-hydroxyphenylacetate 3-hydroxylase, reductase component n=1 Tax=Corynebacterium occultum TaxID=2675219 RepID=A0A6B8W4P7_9CORY|nr:flavin reductase [Corynebacterium occultum]QGU06907.1 p-hydroxyphenylacetate 3-hydroxylase, reductase component [Corynebacterium occultum]
MSGGSLKKLMTAVDPAMIVVTTIAEGERAGCLLGFHSQSGISPQHYCFWLSKANHTYRVSLRARYFALHFLTSQDLALAEHFGTQSGEDTDKFSGVDLDPGEKGLPLLRACPHRLVLERLTLLDDGSDHVCLSTRVLSAHGSGIFEPLRFSETVHLDPGHASEERAIQP